MAKKGPAKGKSLSELGEKSAALLCKIQTTVVCSYLAKGRPKRRHAKFMGEMAVRFKVIMTFSIGSFLFVVLALGLGGS